MTGGVRACLLLAALVLGSAACNRGPAAVRPPAPPVSTSSLGGEAAEALDKGDYAKAAELFRKALAGSPEALTLHYGLAVAASYLNLKAEAIREFRWVVERGGPRSSEVETARRWLIAAGVLRTEEATDAAKEDERPTGAMAGLEGQMLLGEPAGPAKRRMVILYGRMQTPTQDERYQTRTDEDGRFRLTGLKPGVYMITDGVAGTRNWRLRVELSPGPAQRLDLTPANGVGVKDDFPNG
jgi:tetratricopeptide (TPR) repeat protein